MISGRQVLIALLALGQIGVNFLIQWCILSIVGPGVETDAFIAGQTLPSVLLSFVTGSLVHATLPVMTTTGEDRRRRIMWTLLILIGVTLTVIGTLLYVTAAAWIPVLFNGFNDAQSSLAIDLARIHLLGLPLAGVSGVLTSVCYAQAKFGRAEAVPLLLNLAMLGLLVAALPEYGIVAAAWLSIIRLLAQVLLLMPQAGAISRPSFDYIEWKYLWPRARPILAGSALFKCMPVLDRYLASMAPAGGLALLNFAGSVTGAGIQVADRALANPLLTSLSHRYQEGEWRQFSRQYRATFLSVVAAAVCVYATLYGLQESIIKGLSEPGRISREHADLLMILILALGGQFCGGIGGQIAMSGFYAIGDTLTPTRIGVVGAVAGAALRIFAYGSYGLIGIAAATSVHYLLNMLAGFLLFERRTAKWRGT